MSLRARVVVLSAALTARAMPLVIGFLVATLFHASAYADVVLLITASNLCGSLPMLAVTPQIIRSDNDGLALWLASRGLLAGLPLILASAWIGSHLIEAIHNVIFLAAYASAVFVFGVTQALQNQRLEHERALQHALTIASLAITGGLVGYLTIRSVSGFLDTLATVLLAGSLISFASIRVRHLRSGREWPKPHIFSGALDALWSGMFSLLVIAGLFVVGLLAKGADDPPAYIAFTLGLQVFSVVVFIPGALSSYFVPRLVRAGKLGANDALTATVRAYTLIALPSFLLALALAPLCFRYLHVSADSRQWVVFGLTQIAAVLAAINAAYNQMLVGLGRFSALVLLSLLWFAVLVGTLALVGRSTTWIAGSLVIAYTALLPASSFACRRTLSQEVIAR